MIRRLSVFVVLAGLLLAGCAPGEPDGIRVEDAWVRAASASTASVVEETTAEAILEISFMLSPSISLRIMQKLL